MARQRKQARTKTVTTFDIIKDPAFRTGAMDAALGRPFDELRKLGDQWNYERGRLFAVTLRAEGVKSLPPLPQRGDKDPQRFLDALSTTNRLFREGVLL